MNADENPVQQNSQNQPDASQPDESQPDASQPDASQPAATGQATQLQVSTSALPIEVNNQIADFQQEIRKIVQEVSDDPAFVTAITDGVTEALEQLVDSRLKNGALRNSGIGATTNTAVAAAVSGAKNVGMGFVDFTQGLISGTFSALVKATIDQMKGYSEMVADLTKSLKEFATENVSESAIDDKLADLTFSEEAKSYPVLKASPKRAYHFKTLYALAPETGGHKISIVSIFAKDAIQENSVNEQRLQELFDGYEVNDPSDGIGGSTDNDKKYTPENITTIRNAIKYGLAKDGLNQLRQMASEGMARIVVTEGEINTKLTFSIKSEETTNRNSQSKTESSTGVSGNVNARAGWFWGRVSASVSSSYNRLNVNTVDDKTVSNIQSSTEMFGEVKLKFKTDYRPLGQNLTLIN